MSWEAWGTPEDVPECKACDGEGQVEGHEEGQDSGPVACDRCDGTGVEPTPQRMEDDVI